MKRPDLLRSYWFLSGITICQALSFAPTPTPEAWRPGMKCPTQIDAIIPGPPVPFRNIESIHAAMLVCPDITSLHVARHEIAGTPDSMYPILLPFNPDNKQERYTSAPETLALDGYWSDETRTNFSVGTEFDTKCYPDWYARYEAELLSSTRSGTGDRSTPDGKGEAGPEVQKVVNRAGPEIGSSLLTGPPGTPFVIPSFITERPRSTRTSPPRPTTSPLTNFDRWLQVMDFSRIHTLTMSGQKHPSLTMNVARKLPAQLKSLHTVDLKDSPISVFEAFLTGLQKNTLKSLTWRDPWAPKDPDPNASSQSPLSLILQQQGGSLETLYFHSTETSPSDLPTLSLPEVEELVQLAPNLRKLTIDLRRTPLNQWPYDELRLLATHLPRLTDLTIYFQLRVHDPPSHPPPSSPSPATCPSPHNLPSSTPQCAIPENPCRAPPKVTLEYNPFPFKQNVTHPDDCEGPCVGPARFATPMVTLRSKSAGQTPGAQEIMRFLSQHRRETSGVPFQRIRIRSGYPLGWGSHNAHFVLPANYCSDERNPRNSKLDWVVDKSTWVTCHGREWKRRELGDGDLWRHGWYDRFASEGVIGGDLWSQMSGDSDSLDEGIGFKYADEDFICHGGENLRALREWEWRCSRPKYGMGWLMDEEHIE